MIVIPAWAWQAAVDAFADAPASEARVAFLDGVAGGRRPVDGGVVTTVAFPPPEAESGDDHLGEFGLVRLAELHTHPPDWTALESALSQPGALSIALPGHALACPGLGDALVQVREERGWRELEHGEVDDYVCVVPSLIRHC